MRTEIVIDFEFTGLDNTFITDNEIIQVKAKNVETGKTVIRYCDSKKELSAYNFLSHKVKRYENELNFNELVFLATLEQVSGVDHKDVDLIGYGVSQDLLMLSKYGIILEIKDIREMMQRSKFELQMATEGSNLEVAFYLATGNIMPNDCHHTIDEIKYIAELYEAVKDLELKEFLTVMPHGHCAGMHLQDYVSGYRRAVDGYRYNNHDLLSKSLDYWIEEIDGSFQDDEDDDF
jgi:hypothetical protein